MSTVSKTLAKDLASELLKPLNLKVSKAFAERGEALENILLARVPSIVLDVFKKFPQYIETGQHFNISGEGFDYTRIAAKNKIICAGNTNIVVDKIEAEKLKPFCIAYESLRTDVSNTREELEAVLYGLRTYKRVLEAFPELEKFLPASTTKALALDLTVLKAKLK